RAAVTVFRPQSARATRVPLRMAWWMPRGATPSPIACRAAIPERTGERVGRATAHRQDDSVHAVDAALGTRDRGGGNDRRALDGDQCRVRRQRHALAEQARVVFQICTLPLYRLC